MAKEYLNVMQDTLDKKEQILKGILSLSEEQRLMAESTEMDWEAFDGNVERKGELIDALLKLDEGFDALYGRVKETLNADKESYKENIRKMQDRIRSITELSAQIETIEKKNRNLIEKHFTKARNDIRQSKVGTKAAMEYYQKMNRINTVDPQLMDKKS